MMTVIYWRRDVNAPSQCVFCSFRAYFLGEAGLVRVNEWEVLTMKIRPPAV